MAFVEEAGRNDEFVAPPPSPDVPINPYSLLEAVNAASGAARSGWVLFLAILTFILVAVAGITHRDLLLNTKVDLPMLQVGIELTRFFLFAPILLLFVHLGLLVQHVMLARKTIEFDRALKTMEATRRRTHPLRLELHSYYFTQALAGPHRGWLLGACLHSISWVSLVVLPVLIILFTQVVFLPYHDKFITWGHRLVLVSDMAILSAMGVFLRRPEASFFGALFRVMQRHPINVVVTGSLFLVVGLLSFFVATIPGEQLDKYSRSLPTGNENVVEGDTGAGSGLVAQLGDALLSSRESGRVLLETMFSRDLTVTDTDLVSDKDDNSGEVSLVLRDRDLQNAKLDRSDLHRADFTGANLTGASLRGTDLRNTRMSCASVDALTGHRESCTVLTGAFLKGAKLNNANLAYANLVAADLENAILVGADLKRARLDNANLVSADLRRARLTDGADLHGANLLGANLQGAYLSGANAYGADFASAEMQGAMLGDMRALGANFQGADLSGAYLEFARLHGADLRGATLNATNLSNVKLWLAEPPEDQTRKLLSTRRMSLKPPDARDRLSLQDAVTRITDPLGRARVQRLLSGDGSDRWEGSPAHRSWNALKSAGGQDNPEHPKRLADILGWMSCRVDWIDGAVANGIIARTLTPSFDGDIIAIQDHLTGGACPAMPNLDKKLRQKLNAKVDKLKRRNRAESVSTASE